jgi:hypothetical protein
MMAGDRPGQVAIPVDDAAQRVAQGDDAQRHRTGAIDDHRHLGAAQVDGAQRLAHRQRRIQHHGRRQRQVAQRRIEIDRHRVGQADVSS